MSFFMTASPKTNGLKDANIFNEGGIVSIGKMVFEKNNKKAATDIEARIAVSSDLKI